MSTSNCLASACGSCRYCRYFTPEGRRGGHCEQLGVPVQSKWKACMLALPPFAPSWEMLEQSIAWQPETVMVQKELAFTTAWSSSDLGHKDVKDFSDPDSQNIRSITV